jgi:hypothetical protein
VVSSVFATPRGGTHRIDKFPGSVQVSDVKVEITNSTVKDRLIQEHKKSIE